MKGSLVVCLAVGFFAALAAAAEVVDDPLVTLESKVEHDGKFHYHYETGQGSKVSQDGYLKNIDPEHGGEAVQGQFSYISKDNGNEYAITYTADENGYQPQGAHLPTPPPIPPQIQRALEYIAAHPYVEPENKVTKG